MSIIIVHRDPLGRTDQFHPPSDTAEVQESRPYLGAFHTDLERGFIRAEVISVDECIALGGLNEAKKAGKLRIEGKDYIVQDGEIFHVRFNV